MKGRLVLSGISIVLYVLFRALWAPYANLLRASAGVGQLSNDPVTVGISLAFAKYNLPVTIANVMLLVFLLVIWAPFTWKVLRRAPTSAILLVLAGSLVFLLSACAPYNSTKPVQIQPNQTAFMLPAQGDSTDQAKFDSISYLKSKQVASKVVEITYREHQKGRGYWNIDFIPNNILVLVDRKPASRQWTYNKNTGTAPEDQAIALESKESIGFHHGVVVNAVIEEDDAATFLYYYGGAGVISDKDTIALTGIQLSLSLDQVMDTFVRTWVSQQLYGEFKSRDLATGQNDAAAIFVHVETQAKDYFKTYGITILSLGGIEGLIYDSDLVQSAIDEKFNVASQATAQAVVNEKNVVQANAQATITVKQAQAEAQALQLTGDQLAKFPSLVNKMLAEKSTGQVPQVLVIQNSDNGVGTMPFPFWFYYPQGGNQTTPSLITPTPTPTSTAVPGGQ